MADERVLGGRYRLLSLLGRGGMGEVWRGVDELLDRPVAVKLVRAERGGSDEAAARFRREARVTARLAGHPNIVILHDFGRESDGSVYTVMELVAGRPLADVLRESSPLPVERAADLMSQAASGLGAAHAAGIVHRDVKPGNLMVIGERTGLYGGTLKVLDFGIAGLTASEQSRRLTQTGRVLGTPLYMAPEQVRGERVGQAGDLYSLGAILYQMLTGEPPFPGDDPLTVLRGHLRKTPRPVASLRPGLPGPLAELVDALLAKRAEERPASAEEVRERLAPFAVPRPSRPTVGPDTGGSLPVPRTLPYTEAAPPPPAARGGDRTELRLLVERAQEAAGEGRFAEAAAQLRPLLPRLRAAFGPDDPETLRARRREAYLTGKGGAHARAAESMEALLPDILRVHGPRHPETLTVRYYLATNAGRAGDHARAARVHAELLPDLAAVYGPDSERVLTTRLYLAFETGEAGEPGRAVEVLDGLIPELERVLGADHPTTLRAHHYQAAYLGHAGDPAEAARRYRKLVARHVRVFGEESPETVRVAAHLRRWHGLAKRDRPKA
ncbi:MULTISPECIES: serine/threonine-protein kinase [Nocardiopsis]|uniref:non-specific serine/threonine protein kinase n=1 Tax=Nocardiopsis changdeensis TaxID=2831969 RepID=A0ABX8BI00_9ACTN|nr:MULTISPECIES: serine/threonine-protein kinase [Nocardiopsis]QUX21018.1 protein kinase [Nocardiopsis changdeensis]QYX36948.1 serine/threonine protein kinase [Nocardiopsis sp. MT53]